MSFERFEGILVLNAISGENRTCFIFHSRIALSPSHVTQLTLPTA